MRLGRALGCLALAAWAVGCPVAVTDGYHLAPSSGGEPAASSGGASGADPSEAGHAGDGTSTSLAGAAAVAGADGGRAGAAAGAAGSAGAPPSASGAAGSAGEVAGGSPIDDFEDGDDRILPNEGRDGVWSVQGDGTGTVALTIQPDAVGGSSFAARATGAALTTWGGLLSLELRDQNAADRFYDASGWVGIVFSASVEAGSSTSITLMFRDRYTDPEGGICQDCLGYFSASLVLDTTLREYRVRFDELVQVDWGDRRPELDAASLMGVYFLFGANQDFALWIDDVAFFR